MRQNEGEYQLINVLSHFEVPYKYTMNARIEEIKEEVSQIERQGAYYSLLIYRFFLRLNHCSFTVFALQPSSSWTRSVRCNLLKSHCRTPRNK